MYSCGCTQCLFSSACAQPSALNLRVDSPAVLRDRPCGQPSGCPIPLFRGIALELESRCSGKHFSKVLVYALKNAPDRLYCQVILLEVYENYESLSGVSANPRIFSSRDFDIFRTIKQLRVAVKGFFLEVHYVLDRYHQPIYIANLEYLGRFK